MASPRSSSSGESTRSAGPYQPRFPTATEVGVDVPADATLSPITPFITPSNDFYRIDTALSFPRINLSSWRVDIGGMVDKPLTFSYDDLLARPQVERIVTLCCVSNEVGGEYISNASFQGVLLADLLREAGVQSGAQQVFSTSLDGWTCGFPVAVALDGRDAMIAVGMNGAPLPLEHGFPARLVVPGLYGYVSATKWLRKIELTTWDAAEGFWVPRGWARDAPVKTQSRIDVPREGEHVTAGPTKIAGIAWAQHRGVERRSRCGSTTGRGRRLASAPTSPTTPGANGCSTGMQSQASTPFKCGRPTRPGRRRPPTWHPQTPTAPPGITPEASRLPDHFGC